MKPVWKWIIGIVLGLIVVAALVGVGFWVFRGAVTMHQVAVRVPANGQPGQPGRPFFGRGFGMREFGMPGYGMHGYGMMGWGMQPFGGILGGLFFLGLVALLVLAIIWLVRSLRTPKLAAVATHACPNCGKSVQTDWRNCPYCGKKL